MSEGDLDYSAEAPGKRRWNWPVRESVYHPGAEIATFTSASLARHCGVSLPPLPLDGRWQDYDVDTTAVLGCASDLGLFSSSMPAYSEVALDGFHWFIESVGSDGALWFSVEDPRVD